MLRSTFSSFLHLQDDLELVEHEASSRSSNVSCVSEKSIASLVPVVDKYYNSVHATDTSELSLFFHWWSQSTLGFLNPVLIMKPTTTMTSNLDLRIAGLNWDQKIRHSRTLFSTRITNTTLMEPLAIVPWNSAPTVTLCLTSSNILLENFTVPPNLWLKETISLSKYVNTSLIFENFLKDYPSFESRSLRLCTLSTASKMSPHRRQFKSNFAMKWKESFLSTERACGLQLFLNTNHESSVIFFTYPVTFL